jgi:fatty acid desaturase
MTAIDRTPDPGSRSTKILAWLQATTIAACLISTVMIGLLGPLPLALAVAGIGTAAVGGIQVTVHVRR